MAPKVRDSFVLLETWEAQYDLSVESREEQKRLERGIRALLRSFFLYSKSIGTIEGFGAKYVCVARVESDMTHLVFTGDLFDNGLENGLEGARVVVWKLVQRRPCICPNEK